MSDEITPEKAQAAIDADRQSRANAAQAEIQVVLARHRCTIVAVPQLAPDGRVVAVAQVVAQ